MYTIILLLTTISFFVFIFSLWIPIRMNYQTVQIVWYFFILSLACFAFYIEPRSSNDLYRHYLYIQWYESGTVHLYERSMILFETYLWLISMTDMNGLLPLSAVILFGILIERIASDYIKNNTISISPRVALLYLGEALSATFIIYLISGIRSSLVCAIWAFAYHFYYQNKRLRYYIIMISSCLFHFMAIILICITCIHHKFFIQKKDKISLFSFISFLILILIMNYLLYESNVMISLIESSNSSYLSSLAEKMELYTTGDQVAIRYNIILKSCTCILLLLIVYITKIDRADGDKSLLKSFLLIWLVCNGIPIIQDRLPYAIGVISFPAIRDVNRKGKSCMLVNYLLSTLIILQMIFGIYELLADASFNGIYYRDIIRLL